MKTLITKQFRNLIVLFFITTSLLLPGSMSGQALSGNYTIDAAVVTGGTNFQSFSDFAGSLNVNGISGHVTATVVAGSGPYNEQVWFSNISGTSITAGITLNGNGEILLSQTDSTNRHALRLQDCSYFTINNLHVIRDTASTHAFYGIHIFSTGNHIAITNCEVDIPGTTSTLTGAYIASGATNSILTTGDFHDISINGCTATGGGYGASVFGLISNLASDIVINNNTFYDFHSNGVYLRETQGAVVSNNHLDKRTSNITSANAIQVAQAANINTEIYGNFISVSQVNNGSSSLRGIYLFNGTGHRVYNNVIHQVQLTSGDFTGIEVRTGSTAPLIAFNTISLDNTVQSNGDLFGIAEELSNTGSVLRNNVVNISQPTTGTKAGIVLGASSTVTTAINSDYNLLYVPNGHVGMKGSLTPVYYSSLANWQSASTEDANSLSVDPVFVSPAVPQPTNPAADNAGITYGNITIDVLGVTRAATPDFGAYEFTVTGLPHLPGATKLVTYPNPVSELLYVELPAGSKEIIVSLTDITGKISAIDYEWEDEKLFFNTSHLAKGYYMLRITRDGQVYTSGFLKS